jgi:phospholipase/carboxylesterase
MNGGQDEVLDAIVAVLPPLLNALDALVFIARHFHPPRFGGVMRAAEGRAAALREGLTAFQAPPWPDHLSDLRDHIAASAEAALAAFDGLAAAAAASEGVRQVFRALRHATRAVEALYPVAAMLPPVSRFFLDAAARDDAALVERLAAADPADERIGVMHAGEAKGARGGFSLYVPESYDADRPHPLVTALHGGSGNGALFLWSWLREARSRGAILLAPTAIGDTWSLMEPEMDGANLAGILDHVRERWNVDPARLLLTGMSDGGTFTLVSGIQEGSPFTHLAPIAASFHPLMMAMAERGRVAGLPIYLVHGALDWMFPVSMARTAHAAFDAAGAQVTYREIADLSHAYPREENIRILEWFLQS